MKKCKLFIQSPSYTSLIDSDNYQNDSTLFCELSSRAELHVDMGAKVSREALIKSLSNFILEFLFNARNKSTRIASYLRRLMGSIG